MPLIYANEAFARITGYSVAESLGKNCRFLQVSHHHTSTYPDTWMGTAYLENHLHRACMWCLRLSISDKALLQGIHNAMQLI